MTQVQPRSTKDLADLAQVEVDPSKPIRYYLRSAELLIKQARIYRNEGDLEHAYFLYMKYTNLGIKELPKHPHYNAPENKKALKTVKFNCLESLDALERLKPTLEAEYRKHAEAVEAQKKHNNKKHGEQQGSPSSPVRTKGEKTEIPGGRTENWSLQDALHGLSGIGTAQERVTKLKPDTEAVHYPDSPARNRSDSYHYDPSSPPSTLSRRKNEYAPPLPPKPSFVSPTSDQRPPLPPKLQLPSSPQSALSAPALPPKLELTASFGTNQATNERGEPLRRLNIPAGLEQRFVQMAQSNTEKNIETCGVLCGRLKNNVLTMTTLIIPKQTGTPNTCTTENEEELFEYQDAHDLLTFGWIHTHPSQSCFMSSLDLHTHCSYQLMLPEAIAIVCAPKHSPSFGVFRLTDPPGMGIISECRSEGAFHPHPDMPIYTDTHDDVGHVHVQAHEFEVVDIRN
ncbi:hypothetical protein BCR43DRAFT_510478 [Syncephalastrum racemosum]|uniref:MPN domain-containing protein n=1 Tax=Syncephalastrum racemosum TaxID=13706 RepID=A0A1X2HUZ5_SYNRA|nr:hypothetical protein BCR43DRAFT_510478 [Syncephalastrum racemosum]